MYVNILKLCAFVYVVPLEIGLGISFIIFPLLCLVSFPLR